MYGELIIEFNQVMQTEAYNISQLNSEISHLEEPMEKKRKLNITVNDKLLDLIEIYVLPAEEWNIYTEGFEMQ